MYLERIFKDLMERPQFLELIRRYFRNHSVVAIVGPRQCGKTTLARMYCKEQLGFTKENYFDLEKSQDIERLENPMLALKPLKQLIVIDEIQRTKDLFPIIRVLVDKPENTQKYLVLGSASTELLRQSSESLAGRIAYLELTPFSLQEVDHQNRLWLRGGFPKSYLAETDQDSSDWREFYIRTFLEQDIPNLGIKILPASLRRFWRMLAHFHGNIFNASEIGRSFGSSDALMRTYLDVLSGALMIRQLQPWHENIGKRQVKSPKIYFRDSGIFHSLLGTHTISELHNHPKVGASWEGFALEEVIRAHSAAHHECYFWSTYSGAEVELLLYQNGMLTGFEFKYQDAPKLSKSMSIALHDLPLKHLYVIYPGDLDYPLSERVTVLGLQNIRKKFRIGT